MSGGINLKMSRRGRFEECLYWKNDENNSSLNEYSHKKYSDGFFYAKEENAQYSQKNIVGGVFMMDSTSITISTVDSIDINEEDVVKFRDEYWRVVSVQERVVQRRTQFQVRPEDKVTYLQLKK